MLLTLKSCGEWTILCRYLTLILPVAALFGITGECDRLTPIMDETGKGKENSLTGLCVGLAIASLCSNYYVACFKARFVPLSKVLYHTCFICGQSWSRRPKLTSWFQTLNLLFTFGYFFTKYGRWSRLQNQENESAEGRDSVWYADLMNYLNLLFCPVERKMKHWSLFTLKKGYDIE